MLVIFFNLNTGGCAMSAVHDIIGKRAFELLAPEEQLFWKGEQNNLPGYCDLPDLHLASQWDGSGKEKWYAQYGVMPNGRCTPHGPVDKNWSCIAHGADPDASKSLYTLRYYMKKITALIRQKNAVESARFAGTLAHFIQDCCTPGHIINNLKLNHLFPPQAGKLIPLHSTIDFYPFEPELVRSEPEILGRSVEEAAFLLNETLLRNAEIMTGEIVPLSQAIQDNNTPRIQKIMQKWNGISVHLTASLWHTLFAIANCLIPETAQQQFNELDLTTLSMIAGCDKRFDRSQFIRSGIPFYECIYPECDPFRSRLSTDRIPFEPAVNTSYDGNGNAVPLELLKGGQPFRGNGHGIAAGSYGVASFRVPGKLYAGFEVHAGVHYRSESDAKVTFGIWCPEYKPCLLAQGIVSKKEEALHFLVTLPEECQTLILLSAGGNSKLSVVWLDPLLRSR